MASTPDNLKQGARDDAADKGEALPGGRFPIRNLDELDKACQAFSLAKGDKATIKTFILKRAKALGASGALMAKCVALDTSGGDDSDSSDD